MILLCSYMSGISISNIGITVLFFSLVKKKNFKHVEVWVNRKSDLGLTWSWPVHSANINPTDCLSPSLSCS